MIRQEWESTFKKRLEKNHDEMKRLYLGLYHNDEHAFDYFCTMLHDYYEQRPELLKEWDEAREAVPGWFRGNEMLGMLMYVNCFGGNLKGVASHLDYIKEAHAHGIEVNPWTANKEGIIRRIARSGADHIITDVPDVALRIIAELNAAENQ
jgi:amylosucrase